MKWCTSCVLPDSRPNLLILEDGVCNACRGHKMKADIDWESRRQDFNSLVEDAKSRSSESYDCLVPVSGGKDSTWQAVTCLEAGLRVLAVTWRAPGRTAIGQKNLDNLISLGVDHMDFSVSPAVEKKFMLKTLVEAGSPAIPMHLALFNLPLTFAIQFGIPLVVWGENSAAEYGSLDNTDTGMELNSHWLSRYGVSGATTAKDWISDQLSKKELIPYLTPDSMALEKANITSVFLGHYFEWDPEVSSRIAAAHGFRASIAPKTGIYNFADIDDDFISVHHWLKWYKFGFTRAFDNLSLEIRNGRITRREAIATLREYGEGRPDDDIKSLCDFLGLSVEEFFKIADSFRDPKVWTRSPNGGWMISEFIVDDWEWR